MTDEEKAKYPVPGARKVPQALRELVALVDMDDKSTRLAALALWWARWTASAGASSVQPATEPIVGQREKLARARAISRHANIYGLLDGASGVVHEATKHDLLNDVVVCVSSLSVILHEPNPRAEEDPTGSGEPPPGGTLM